MCNSSHGAAGSPSEEAAEDPWSGAVSAVSMTRHRSGFGGVRRSASYTLQARKSFPTGLSISRPATTRPGTPFGPESDPEGFAEAAFAGAGDHHRARIGPTLDPAQVEAAVGQRLPDRAADMQPPLAPVEARAAEHRTVFAGAQIDAEFIEKALALFGHRAAFRGQLDIAALGEGVGKRDAELPGEMVVAGARGAHRRIARTGKDR